MLVPCTVARGVSSYYTPCCQFHQHPTQHSGTAPSVLPVPLSSGPTCFPANLVRPASPSPLLCPGRDLTLTNYLLLGLALFQYPFAFYLGVRPGGAAAPAKPPHP